MQKVENSGNHKRRRARKLKKSTNLDVDFVSAENDGDVLADPGQVLVPGGDVLVCDTRGNVKHDDGTLSLNAALAGGER